LLGGGPPAPNVHTMSLATRPDDGPEVFGIGSDGKLYNIWSNNGVWNSQWSTLGAPSCGLSLESKLTICMRNNGPQVFAIGQDGALWEISLDESTWSSWSSLGNPGSALISISARTRPRDYKDDHLPQVFAVNTTGLLWLREFDHEKKWKPWQQLACPGALPFTGPIAANPDPDTPEVFAADSSGLWHVWAQGDTWNQSQNLGAPTHDNQGNSELITYLAVINAENPEAFVATKPGSLWHIWGPQWSSWADLKKLPIPT
jgi:hypothetical protein